MDRDYKLIERNLGENLMYVMKAKKFLKRVSTTHREAVKSYENALHKFILPLGTGFSNMKKYFVQASSLSTELNAKAYKQTNSAYTDLKAFYRELKEKLKDIKKKHKIAYKQMTSKAVRGKYGKSLMDEYDENINEYERTLGLIRTEAKGIEERIEEKLNSAQVKHLDGLDESRGDVQESALERRERGIPRAPYREKKIVYREQSISIVRRRSPQKRILVGCQRSRIMEYFDMSRRSSVHI